MADFLFDFNMLDDYSFYVNILDCHILHINVADDHTSYNSGINYCILYMTRSLCHIFYINIIDDQILFFKHALCRNIVRSEILRSTNLCELNRCDHTLDIDILQGYTLRRSPFTTGPLTSPATTRLSQSPSFTSKSSATISHANTFCHYALCHHKWRTALPTRISSRDTSSKATSLTAASPATSWSTATICDEASFLVGVVAFVGTMSCVESVSAAGDLSYRTNLLASRQSPPKPCRNKARLTRRHVVRSYVKGFASKGKLHVIPFLFVDMKQSEEIMKQCVIEAKALSKLYTLPENTFVDIRACSVLWTDSAVRHLGRSLPANFVSAKPGEDDVKLNATAVGVPAFRKLELSKNRGLSTVEGLISIALLWEELGGSGMAGGGGGQELGGGTFESSMDRVHEGKYVFPEFGLFQSDVRKASRRRSIEWLDGHAVEVALKSVGIHENGDLVMKLRHRMPSSRVLPHSFEFFKRSPARRSVCPLGERGRPGMQGPLRPRGFGVQAALKLGLRISKLG
ncbi:unnamed protein product [Symbiodinium microadriaticum]|nr:unnamed protein product [Symbiodinium microadriaticum]